MGYLRKNSFLIFSDPDAPAEDETLERQKMVEIEAAHEVAKKGRMEDLIRSYRNLDTEPRLREIVQNVQEAGTDEEALKKYIRTTFRSTNEMNWRTFAWAAHEIVISKASTPRRYVPHRAGTHTVRFRGDGYLAINLQSDGTSWSEDTKNFQLDGSTHPSLWVKVVDGWSEDGNWGGYLQITCVTDKDKYIDSSSGWAKPVASREDKVTFYDMGNYYEIWQGDRETGRPLTVQDECLRFTKGAIPGKWNIQDSTWD
ncbi:hypothetical protein [Pseudomonas sp. UM16]|uniref:hypothetical protein n=1 Tax=Pseudomonas sp. UM16 TaxID=3158962 RepID=UPI00399002C4